MIINNSFKELMNDATLISDELPKCKTVYVSKDIRNKLNLKNSQFVYLMINNLIHPVAFHTSVVSFPKIMKANLPKSGDIKIYIKPIENKELLFLSSFLPVNTNNKIDYYNLPIHKLIAKKTKLKIFCEDKYFYGSSGRNRVNFSKRSLKRLSFKPLNVYQFLVKETSETFNNIHLFKNNLNIDLKKSIKNNKIIIKQLLPDFEIKDLGKKIKVFYEKRCKDSKKVILNKEIKLTFGLFRLFGLYQAEGTKTDKSNGIYFTNNDPNLIKYFKDTFSNIFNIDNKLWRLDIATAYKNKKIKLIKFWSDLLRISEKQIYIRHDYCYKSEFGSVCLGIRNNTIKEIFYRMLNLIKIYILKYKNYCGNFISGVLAGDGCLIIEKNRVKRIELYFNPHRTKDELLFYCSCLDSLNMRNHYIRIYYQKEKPYSKVKVQEIVKKVEGKLNNIKIAPRINNMGIGGTIFIHRKEDIRKLVPYKLFYPNLKHYNKFYKYWRN